MNEVKQQFNKSYLLICILPVLLIVSACENNPTSAEENSDEIVPIGATALFENNGASAYVISSIDGEGISAETGTENPDITIEAGFRYTFDNAAGASSHPLEFRDSEGNVVLGQRGDGGSFADDPDVNAVLEGNRITFTLTTELAALMVDYVCSFHPGMNGSITTVEG